MPGKSPFFTEKGRHKTTGLHLACHVESLHIQSNPSKPPKSCGIFSEQLRLRLRYHDMDPLKPSPIVPWEIICHIMSLALPDPKQEYGQSTRQEDVKTFKASKALYGQWKKIIRANGSWTVNWKNSSSPKLIAPPMPPEWIIAHVTKLSIHLHAACLNQHEIAYITLARRLSAVGRACPKLHTVNLMLMVPFDYLERHKKWPPWSRRCTASRRAVSDAMEILSLAFPSTITGRSIRVTSPPVTDFVEFLEYAFFDNLYFNEVVIASPDTVFVLKSEEGSWQEHLDDPADPAANWRVDLAKERIYSGH